VRRLLDAGADIDAPMQLASGLGTTLFGAALRGHTEVRRGAAWSFSCASVY
jgi:hypothetical protein